MDKKGNLLGGFFLFMLFVMIMLLVSFIFLRDGSSIDYPYGYEKQKGFGWSILYLKDDHKTAYCFDNNNLKPIIDEAIRTNKKIEVFFKGYLFRGMFCSAGEKYDEVVVEDIRI